MKLPSTQYSSSSSNSSGYTKVLITGNVQGDGVYIMELFLQYALIVLLLVLEDLFLLIKYYLIAVNGLILGNTEPVLKQY